MSAPIIRRRPKGSGTIRRLPSGKVQAIMPDRDGIAGKSLGTFDTERQARKALEIAISINPPLTKAEKAAIDQSVNAFVGGPQ